MFSPLSTIKKFHAEICSVTVWLFMRSKNCLSSFTRKFLILLLFYLPVFWQKISSAFAIIFADCHGLSCVHVRASWYKASFRVSVRSVAGLGVWSCSKDICTLQHRFVRFFIFLYLYIYSLSCIITHVCSIIPSARSLRFGSRLWKVNIDQNQNLFYHYLFQRSPVIYNLISQENMFLFAF